MKKKGKVFRNALIFIILIALTFYILLKDDASAGTEILKELNLNLEYLMEDIEDIFNFYKADNTNDEPYPYLINLTKKAMIHPFIKRNNYIERINYILNKKQKKL